MSTRKYIYTIVTILAGWSTSFGFIIDGNLSDWGVTVADNNGSDFANIGLTTGVLAYHIEDQSDTADANWILDPISPKEPVQVEIDASSRQVGTADFIYTRDAVTTQHSIIELAVDESVFPDPMLIQSVQWRPACGNDELNTPLSLAVPTPEPISLLMFALGSLVVIFKRRLSAL